MKYAPLNSDLSYWKKQDQPLFDSLIWNIPEQKTGKINIVGGNSQSFHPVIRIAEFINQNFPVKDVQITLPDTLRAQLPPLPNLIFTLSTTSGSFAKSPLLRDTIENADFTIVAGDLSKNSATAIALDSALQASDDPTSSPKSILITRDSVDLLASSMSSLLQNPELFILASAAQLQKVFRAIYYPKMIMLSQPLVPFIETLHKFTLSYAATIITFHENNIIVAHHGDIITTPVTNTEYSPISLWSGQLAAKIAILNLYNPHKNLEATAAALLFR